MFNCSSNALGHHPRQRCHLIRGHEGVPESTKFVNLIPLTSVALMLPQYSGSRVEHRDGFYSHK